MFRVGSLYRLVIYSIVFFLILTSCFTLIVLNIAQNEFNEKVFDLKETYTADKKALLKNDVDTLLNFIDFYVDEHKNAKTRKQLQLEILKSITKLKKTSQNEYLFIYDFNGTLIYTPSLRDKIGDNFLDRKDKNGKAFIHELITTSKRKNGGFVQYEWLDKSTNTYTQKISYTASYKNWGWTIGKGIYLKKIENLIKQKEKKYDQNIESYLYQIAFLAILLALYSIFIYKNATRVIIKDVKTIREYFEKPNHEKPLNTDNISFGEFKIVAKYADSAVKTIHQKSRKLEDINKNLENMVQDKTYQLSTLVESQKKFIKYSVHEINTPLSIILSNIDLFKIKFPKNGYITNIESAAKILQCIYDELSYLIKEDKFEYKKEYLNFSQVLKERIEFFKEVAKSNSLRFSLNIKEDIYINFNYTKLQRIIDNNLSNAIKYSFANSLVHVGLDYTKDDKIEFYIKTKSKKIDNTKRVFMGFYREDSARGGFGLGLSMVKEICHRDNVSIELTSNEKETKFTYRFNINENTTT